MAEIIWEKYKKDNSYLTKRGLRYLWDNNPPTTSVWGRGGISIADVFNNVFEISHGSYYSIGMYFDDPTNEGKGFNNVNKKFTFVPTEEDAFILFNQYLVKGITNQGLAKWFYDEDIENNHLVVGKYFQNREYLDLDTFKTLYNELFSNTHALAVLVGTGKTNITVGHQINSFLPQYSSEVLKDTIFKYYNNGKGIKSRRRKSRKERKRKSRKSRKVE